MLNGSKHTIFMYFLMSLTLAAVTFFGARFMKMSDDQIATQEWRKSVSAALDETKEIAKANAKKNEEQLKFLNELRQQNLIIRHQMDVLYKLHKLKWEMSGRLDETDNIQQSTKQY